MAVRRFSQSESIFSPLPSYSTILSFLILPHCLLKSSSPSPCRVQNLSRSSHGIALSQRSPVSGSRVARSLEPPSPPSRHLPTEPQLQQDRRPPASAYLPLDDGIRAKKAHLTRRASTSSSQRLCEECTWFWNSSSDHRESLASLRHK